MTKLAQAAKALNDKTLAAPTLGRSVDAPKFSVYRKEENFCRVMNITRLGRLGAHIGWLKLNQQGVWEQN